METDNGIFSGEKTAVESFVREYAASGGEDKMSRGRSRLKMCAVRWDNATKAELLQGIIENYDGVLSETDKEIVDILSDSGFEYAGKFLQETKKKNLPPKKTEKTEKKTINIFGMAREEPAEKTPIQEKWATLMASEKKKEPAKSRFVCGMTAIFFGWLGAHNFMLGNVKRAFAQLILGFGGFLFVSAVLSSLSFPDGRDFISVLHAAIFYPRLYIAVAVFVWSVVEGVLIFAVRDFTDARGNVFEDEKRKNRRVQ
jgi:hypothetical protein